MFDPTTVSYILRWAYFIIATSLLKSKFTISIFFFGSVRHASLSTTTNHTTTEIVLIHTTVSHASVMDMLWAADIIVPWILSQLTTTGNWIKFLSSCWKNCIRFWAHVGISYVTYYNTVYGNSPKSKARGFKYPTLIIGKIHS